MKQINKTDLRMGDVFTYKLDFQGGSNKYPGPFLVTGYKAHTELVTFELPEPKDTVGFIAFNLKTNKGECFSWEPARTATYFLVEQDEDLDF